MSSLDADALSGALARALPTPVTVDGIRRVSGGASRETWLFDAVDAAGAQHALVLRRDPGRYAGQTERSTEFALLDAAHRHGVRVPAVMLMLEPGDIQYCNNYTILHSRTSFIDHDEPDQKRHLLRIWLYVPDGPF